jgi:hypothetical protein
MVAPELAFAEDIKILLQSFGPARLEYITAGQLKAYEIIP